MIVRQKNASPSNKMPKAVATFGFIAVCALGVACGEIDSETGIQTDYPGHLSTSSGMEAELAEAASIREIIRAENPVVDYYDASDNYYLDCRTGAQLEPLHVQPDADIGGWMQACTDQIASFDVSDAQVDECRNDVFDHAFLSRRGGFGTSGFTSKEEGPITNFYHGGHYWHACSNGSVDALEQPNEGEEGYDEFDQTLADWTDSCINSSANDGPIMGVPVFEIHRDLGSRITGSGASNPICQELMEDEVMTRVSGSTRTCSSTGITIVPTSDETAMRQFSQQCKDQDGEIESQEFAVGKDLHRDLIYICSSNAKTVLHSQGGMAFKNFTAHCSADGGTVLRRKFGDANLPEEEASHRYICTGTGETLPHGDSVYDYESFLFDCSQTSGHVLSTVPGSISGVRTERAIGRDGRDDVDIDDLILAAEVVWGEDIHGNGIWICMPGGATLDGDANYTEWWDFDRECKAEGGSVTYEPILVFMDGETTTD